MYIVVPAGDKQQNGCRNNAVKGEPRVDFPREMMASSSSLLTLHSADLTSTKRGVVSVLHRVGASCAL